MKFIAMSLDTLGVDDAKRPEIEKIQSDLRAQMAPARDAEKELLTILAAGIDAGKIDTAKVDAGVAKVAAAAGEAHAAGQDALNKLHDTLSPAERAALVDKVEAHWTVWRDVNPEGNSTDQKNSRLTELTEEVNLTPDQVKKISGALDAAKPASAGKLDAKAVDSHIQAFMTAFTADKFDAKSLPASPNSSIAGHGSSRMANFYETAAPVLTPDQRTQLAQHLREHANYVPAISGK